MPKKDPGKPQRERRKRFPFYPAPEAHHILSLEQEKRKKHGLPHTRVNDILNDWVIEHGQALGHKMPPDDEGKPK